MIYKPKEYWEKRISRNTSLKGVGLRQQSEAYNKYLYKLKRRALEKAMLKNPKNINEAHVLDIGCGTGFWVEYYGNLGCHVWGVDITETSVNLLKDAFPKHHFLRLDIGKEDLCFEEEFDIINSFDVLYHIPNDFAFLKAIENISLVAKKGAQIFITDSLSPPNKQPEHVKFRTLEEYRKSLKKVGIGISMVLPIYHFMNQEYNFLKKYLPSYLVTQGVDIFAPFFFLLDSLYLPYNKSTMKLMCCIKR